MTGKGLGRGLNALLGDSDETVDGSSGNIVKMVSLRDLEPSPFQPRRVFNEEAINDLVESIKTKGILQPLIVRAKNGVTEEYEIVGGERRWRAAQMAGLEEVPVLIKHFSDKEALEVALIENLQRQDLNPLEEAEGYHRLMDEFSNTQEELAQAVGKSRSHVANTMRLLGLPEKVKKLLETGKLTSGHARALLTSKDPETLADMVINRGLNVRQTEKLVQDGIEKKKPRVSHKTDKQDECDSLAADLSRILGITVAIKPKTHGGELILSYETLEQLDTLIRRLSVKSETVQTDKKAIGSQDEFSADVAVSDDIIKSAEDDVGDVVFDSGFSDALGEDVITAGDEDKDDVI